MSQFIVPVVALGAIGGLFGVMLQYASTVFYVEVDDRVVAVIDALPGANCGACGFPGCAGLAEAIVAGSAPVNACPVGGQPVADNVADIMGVNSAAVAKNVAVVLCQGDCEKAKEKFEYKGTQDCRIMNMYYEGNKSCEYGCLGGGSCYDVCEFDAIRMIDGIAVIDKEKCTACNKCVEICPKHIIEMVPYSAETIIKCKSEDSGKVVRQNCSIGCIGCKICVKNCPEQTIGFENNLAKIDYTGCTNCGTCVVKCPTKAITAEYDAAALVEKAAN